LGNDQLSGRVDEDDGLLWSLTHVVGRASSPDHSPLDLVSLVHGANDSEPHAEVFFIYLVLVIMVVVVIELVVIQVFVDGLVDLPRDHATT